MSQKIPEHELCAPFRFTQPSERLRNIKSRLLHGESISVEELDGSDSYLVHYFPQDVWSADELTELSAEMSDMGMHERFGLTAHMLGDANAETRLIDETISAGFTVYLLADPSPDGHVVGYFTMRACIADNT